MGMCAIPFSRKHHFFALSDAMRNSSSRDAVLQSPSLAHLHGPLRPRHLFVQRIDCEQMGDTDKDWYAEIA